MDDLAEIKIVVAAPPHIDPAEHCAALYAIHKLDTLGMAWAHHPPTLGLMSYLHDPARRAFVWNRRTEIVFGESEESYGLPRERQLTYPQLSDDGQ